MTNGPLRAVNTNVGALWSADAPTQPASSPPAQSTSASPGAANAPDNAKAPTGSAPTNDPRLIHDGGHNVGSHATGNATGGTGTSAGTGISDGMGAGVGAGAGVVGAGSGGSTAWGTPGFIGWGSDLQGGTFSQASGAPGTIPNSTPLGNTFTPRGQSQPPFVSAPGTPNALPLASAQANPLPGMGFTPHALPPQGTVAGQVSAAGQSSVFAPMSRATALPVNVAQGALPGVSTLIAQPPVLPARPTSQAQLPQTPMTQGLANPRANAAAAALQGRPSAVTQMSVPPATVLAQSAKPAQAAPLAQAMSGSSVAAVQATPTQPWPGAARAAQAAAQAQIALAQQALAQALGKLAAGQLGAGAVATALAEGQLALRAGRMALTQATMQGLALPGESRANAAGQAAALAKPASEHIQPLAQAATGATMPRALAFALAVAPKQRKRGSHARIEAIDRFTPRRQAPEMEDEDFWDSEDENAARERRRASDGKNQTHEEHTTQPTAAEIAAHHYHAMRLWLGTQGQTALLRELATGRRVLVLAPPDKAHQRLLGHLLRPDLTPKDIGAPAGHAAPGTTGRAWALAARWQATLPADGQWRLWRLRQMSDGEGQWQLEASRPDRHTPRVLLQGAAHGAGSVAAQRAANVGESITVLEPRRLRRLLDTQWTVLTLRVPVPLNAAAQAGTAP